MLPTRYCSQTTEIILTPCSVVHPASRLIFFGSEEYAAQGCELKGNILHVKLTDCFMLYSTLEGWLFFSATKVQNLLLFHPLFYFHLRQTSFLMSNYAIPPWDTSKSQGWFSLHEPGKVTLHWDSWDIAVSSFSLSAAPSWMSGIHRHWGRIMFAWILKTGCLLGMNTLQQLLNFAALKAKLIPKAAKTKREIKLCLAHQFRIWLVLESFAFAAEYSAHEIFIKDKYP